MAELHIRESNTAQWLEEPVRDGQAALWWLGQAGFAVRFGRRSFLIDPYLSGSLAEKYKGKDFPHIRMMPAPIAPESITTLGWVFCTHRHSDHMDPGTLPIIARNIPGCRFFVPAAEFGHAVGKAGLPPERTTGLDDGQTIELDAEITVSAIASAHEELRLNDRGQHEFLGYVFRLGVVTVYHSGDCVPYDGLEERLAELHVDVAMLPVNGRDEYRASRNVAGNFHFEEALALCSNAGIGCMIAHHFGMFAFNTVDPSILRRKAAGSDADVQVCIPQVDRVLLVDEA